MDARANLSKTSQVVPISRGTVIALASNGGQFFSWGVMKNTAVTEAQLARLEQLRNIPIESVADKASMLIMAATMARCIQDLAISESEEETSHIIGAAFQLLFMLGRQSVLN
jgi:hypothetical protein